VLESPGDMNRTWIVCLCLWACPAVSSAAPPLETLLLDAASAAAKRRELPLAATLLQGAWEISQEAGVLRRLAKAQSDAGLLVDSLESYELLLRSKPAADAAREAKAAVERLRQAPPPPPDQMPKRLLLSKEAKRAFTHGVALARQKKQKLAIRYLRASLVLDPTLPGAHRVLGLVYGQMGDPLREREYLLGYLRLRPDGPIADVLRRRLKPSGLLGSVDVGSSYPCDVWVNGRALRKRTPLKGLLLPPGNHTLSLVNGQYHFVRNRHVTVLSGRTEKLEVPFGLLTVKLEPWARILADGMDLGLWETIGLPTGEHELSLTAHDGSRKKRMKVLIKAGSTLNITSW
jgi:tetratricopeptide (TPR) repeat protein